MNIVNANQALKNIEGQCIYVYISGAYDLIKISFELLDAEKIKKNFYSLYTTECAVWEKNEIIELCNSFSITTIIFPDGSQANTKDLSVRKLKYEEQLKEILSPYGKKLIYLIKRTKLAVYMNVLRKKNLIVLAKPVTQDISIEIYRETSGNYIPAFSDSNLLRLFLAKHSVDSEYKPLVIPFKKLALECIGSGCTYVWLNPECCDIHKKKFSIKLTQKLFKYTYETVRQEYKS